MEAVFLKMVNMSINAGWLVLAIITVRLVFRKTPKWILCLLWGLVAVRLICPFSLESALSLIPSAEPLPQEILYTAHPEIQSGVAVIDKSVNPILESSMAPAELASANPTQIWSFILSQVWILGVVLMIAYTAVSFFLLKRSVATAIPLEKGIKQCEFVDSPFVLGLFHPVIYLPFTMDSRDLAYVIAHERAHIRRKDHWWKPVGFLLLSIYWFHPLLWVAYILLCRDIEAACDEKVIQDMDKDERRAYSTALLNFSIHRRSIAACPLAFGETGVKARVKSVMNYKKPAFWVILITHALCIVVSLCFFTDPAGMHLYEIDDSRNYADLFDNIESITLIKDGKKSTVSDSDALLKILEEIKVRKITLLRDRSEDRDKFHQIHLKGNTYLNFSADYSHVWIDNGVKPTYSYSVIHSAKVREIFRTLWDENSSGIGTVYTWFDRYSANPDENYPKDPVVKLPGMDGFSLSYDFDKNEIQLIHSGGLEPILTCDSRIQNVFLADLSNDDVPEVCATLENQDGIGVAVYDVAVKEKYELLSFGDTFSVLTQKAGWLCVLNYDANWYVQSYGLLTLENSETLKIKEPVPEVMALTKKVVCVDVWTRKSTCLSSRNQVEKALSLLRNLEEQTEPVSAEEMAAVQEDPFNHSSIIVNYELGEKTIYFSRNFDIVWEYGSSKGYRIRNSEPIREFVNAVTNGVHGKLTLGDPFATIDTPWDWCRDISADAVSAANVYVCLDKTTSGNTTSVSATSGVLPYHTLSEMIGILNKIPKESISPYRILERENYHSFYANQREGNISVSITDGVNDLAVILRRNDGKVELLLTDELEKAEQRNGKFLVPTQVWTIQDDTLDAFLLDATQNPPVIQYTVGAEYDWQEPIVIKSGSFSLALRLIEGWEYQYVSNPTDSGIRCRPKDITEGWIYFSYWPKEYTPEEENRFILDGMHYDWIFYTSYPDSIANGRNFDTRNAIWSYQRYDLEMGDYAVINEGADTWFLAYQDQISDIITLSDISVE